MKVLKIHLGLYFPLDLSISFDKDVLMWSFLDEIEGVN